ncbi:MAG: thioredoxin domain-containing protein [Solirubrobacterales bacterium]
MSEVAVKPLPRRGRIWVALLLAAGLVALAYAIVNISTQKPDNSIVHIEGISEAQEIFGGVPQEGDRLGSNDAGVTIQVFNDIQCSSCREAFLSTIPALTENYARPGDVKLLYRHYSNAENPEELGFYGAEAAAEQGYGWQYIYLFFRNQDEAERVGIDQDFLDSVAGSVEELNGPEWEDAMEKATEPDSPISQRLDRYEELGRDLEIRTGQAMIVSGPGGTRTLQDSPTLAEVERAIGEVS